MDLALAGRVAMITGPAKGMGAAVTRAFAHEGISLETFRPALAPQSYVALASEEARIRILARRDPVHELWRGMSLDVVPGSPVPKA